MCGLVCANVPVDAAVAALAHRGVRHRIARCGGNSLWLGHVRLPIVGLGEENDQPVRTNGGWLAFVGEILNFREIDKTLECDLPLVRRTWAKRSPLVGPVGFKNFDGFWAVVVADDDGSIHALCDYLAQKPLYYRSDRVLIAVASEPDALLALAPTTPDHVYLSAVVKWGYCPETRRTPHAEIKKMLPGEYLRLDLRPGWVERRVIDPLEVVDGGPADLKNAIEGSVRRRVLASDVPVACLLSGGLDSAIVYTLAGRHGDVTSFHVINGETDWARRVGGDELVVVRDEWASTDQALAYMQEPLDLGSLLPQAALSNTIGVHQSRGRAINVALTGDGADEFFGGYGRAQRYDSQASDVFHELVAWHLPRLDRVMMRNKIEVRSPFLARRVAGLALGLPRELRTGKKVLRDLFLADLGDEVANQPKRPLRVKEVEEDREGWSQRLVQLFVEKTWPDGVFEKKVSHVETA